MVIQLACFSLRNIDLHCCVSKDSKKDDDKINDKQDKVSAKEIGVHTCNSRDILAKLVETGCKSNWTSFKDLYAKGSQRSRVIQQTDAFCNNSVATVYSITGTLRNR